jgi:hypothetical protein
MQSNYNSFGKYFLKIPVTILKLPIKEKIEKIFQQKYRYKITDKLEKNQY